MLIALAVALSPIYFVWGPTKALPWQHMVNILAGIMLGPFWAVIVALFAGTIRIILGTGTIFAYPGGLPGGFIVGLTYRLLSSLARNKRLILIASSLTEPLGTCCIGGAATWYLWDPILGDALRVKFGAFLLFVSGWFVSSIIGVALGLSIILVLDKVGVVGRST